jgi:hypothetical protein
LGHVAFVAVHGVHHEVKDGVNESTGVFRVEVTDESRGAGHVGKEGGDRLALAVGDPSGFHGRLLSPNPCSQMRWSVARRGLDVRGWTLGT